MGGDEMLSDRSFDKLNATNTVGEKNITLSYLEGWRKRHHDILRKVKSFICYEHNCDEVSGRDLITAEIITRYVLKTIDRDIELLKSSGENCF
ncbi:hypothetical protein, partial [Salmonella enterica]|uniref:hypothetical protein n=1 Tax=Salmonella enterica TaxID=28901 RepID=UPI0020C55978